MRFDAEEMDFETILADERPRLVRLCAWFAGSQEAAEDLAQETLIAAWKSRDQLSSFDKLKPWTSAIARNICLNWSRRHYREQAHLVYSIDSQEEPSENELQDETDLELELDRYELATLLDRALSLLPEETAQMLVEHYIKESSHAEIAERMQINPGTVAVRLQRGKLTLQRLLRTKLQAESSAFGLVEMGVHNGRKRISGVRGADRLICWAGTRKMRCLPFAAPGASRTRRRSWPGWT